MMTKFAVMAVALCGAVVVLSACKSMFSNPVEKVETLLRDMPQGTPIEKVVKQVQEVGGYQWCEYVPLEDAIKSTNAIADSSIIVCRAKAPFIGVMSGVMQFPILLDGQAKFVRYLGNYGHSHNK